MKETAKRAARIAATAAIAATTIIAAATAAPARTAQKAETQGPRYAQRGVVTSPLNGDDMQNHQDRNPQPERKRWPVGVGNTGGTRAGSASPPCGNTRRERRGKRHRRQASAHEKPNTKKPKTEQESAGKPFRKNPTKPGRKPNTRDRKNRTRGARSRIGNRTAKSGQARTDGSDRRPETVAQASTQRPTRSGPKQRRSQFKATKGPRTRGKAKDAKGPRSGPKTRQKAI